MTKKTSAKSRGPGRPRPRKQQLSADTLPDIDTEVLWKIRGILDEKKAKGRVFYLVDWEDHPTTGEKYEASWEPAENVTEAAVQEWEDTKPKQDPPRVAKRRPGPSSWERAPKRARTSSRQASFSTANTSDEPESHEILEAKPKTASITVEIAARPDFNPSEYSAVSQKQPSHPSEPLRLTRHTVIPDSQESTGSLALAAGGTELDIRTSDPYPDPEILVEVPEAQVQIAVSLDRDSEAPNHSSNSGGSRETQDDDPVSAQGSLRTGSSERLIPSHQPDHSRHGSQSVGITAEDTNSGDIAFLTQPEFDLPVFPHPSSSPAGQRYYTAEPESPKSVISETSSQAPPISRLSQSAQIVPQDNSRPDQSWEPLESQSEVVAETAKKPTGRQPEYSEPTPALSELSGVSEEPLGSNNAASPAKSSFKKSLSQQPLSQHSSRRPVTPQSPTMDHSSGRGGTPRSAFDELREKKEAFFAQGLSASNPSPSPTPEAVAQPSVPVYQNASSHLANQSHYSTVEQEDLVLGVSDRVPAPALMAAPPNYEQTPTTIAPHQLHTLTDHEVILDPDLPIEDHRLLAEDDSRSALEAYREDDFEGATGQGEFLITLPLAANSRDRYLRIIQEEKETMIEFGNVFTSSLSRMPSPALVTRMDAVFEKLLDICDLPAYAQDLAGMTANDMARHATNTNSKFLFLNEFLMGLGKDISMRVLVVARPGPAFEYLEALLTMTDIDSLVLGRDDLPEHQTGDLTVILAKADQGLFRTPPRGVDVVILFDDAARAITLPRNLGYADMGEPVRLSLVATYCVDHINAEFAKSPLIGELDGLERKNALNGAVVTAKKYLKAAEFRTFEGDYPEPHVVAKQFADFLASPGTSSFNWNPQPFPAEIFDLWESSQRETVTESSLQQPSLSLEAPKTRKRPLENAEEDDPKRLRTLDLRPARPLSDPILSDLLKDTMARFSPGDAETPTVEVPVRQLEAMAAKMKLLEDCLGEHSLSEKRWREHTRSLEAQVLSYERTAKKIAAKYKEAIGDRGTYEHGSKLSEEKSSRSSSLLEASRAESEALRHRLNELESQLIEARTALESSANPDVAQMAKLQREHEEALARIRDLEKKVASTENLVEYSRDAYQKASSSHSILSKEHQEMKDKLAELERQARENIVKITEINTRSQQDAELRQVDELRALLRDREYLLTQAREELGKLKNGRRETRQSSVPRSPRVGGFMSPRPNRGAGSGSRGASPAPQDGSGTPAPGGMTFLQQPPRGSHLRE